jgi:hypothetical protein
MMGWKGSRDPLIGNYIRVERLCERNTPVPIHLIARDPTRHDQR